MLADDRIARLAARIAHGPAAEDVDVEGVVGEGLTAQRAVVEAVVTMADEGPDPARR